MKNLSLILATDIGTGSEAAVPFIKHTQSALIEVADLKAQASYSIALQPSRTKVHGTIHCGSKPAKVHVQLCCGDVLDVLRTVPSESVHCCITSPPYYRLRDYGVDGQIGLEETPEEYINKLVGVFHEVKRVLRHDGTLWLNIGNSYSTGSGGSTTESETQKNNKGTLVAPRPRTNHQGNPQFDRPCRDACKLPTRPPITITPKNLLMIPARLAIALQDDGWILRSDIIWAKPNPMPESVKDRPTKSHEHIFLFSQSRTYYYDADAIAEDVKAKVTGHTRIRFGGKKYGDNDDPRYATKSGNEYVPTGKRNKRDIWTITSKPFKGAHFAVFPPELPETCLLAGSPEGGVVLDPFSGASTTGIVAVQHGRSYMGIELNPEYVELSKGRFEREFGVELTARSTKAPEQPDVARTVEASCKCAITANIVKLHLDKVRRYDERMLALAATELAA